MPSPASLAMSVRSGAVLAGPPGNAADAVATVRDLIAMGADFSAGPLKIAGRDFANYGITQATVFDGCALAHIDPDQSPIGLTGAPSVSNLAGSSFPTCTGVGIKTKKAKHGYDLSVTRADGVTARYVLDTRYQTVTPQ